MLRFIKIFLTFSVIVYGIPLTTWLFLRWWWGESNPAVGMMNAAGIVWFAPLLVLLPVALLARARQATLMCLLMTLIALYLFGSEFTPRFALSVPESSPKIRVMTFNALISNTSYDEIDQLIREQQPDIFAIQELSHHLADELNARVGETYPFQINLSSTYVDGIGLWSRYPLTAGESRGLPSWNNWMHTATVEVQGRKITLFNVHLWPIGILNRQRFAHAIALQHRQVQELRDLMATVDGPLLFFGDLNASPTNETYEIFATELSDVWREVGWGPGFTFPAARPSFLRIDYFWRRGNITPLNIKTAPNSGSDHLPVIADFAIEP